MVYLVCRSLFDSSSSWDDNRRAGIIRQRDRKVGLRFDGGADERVGSEMVLGRNENKMAQSFPKYAKPFASPSLSRQLFAGSDQCFGGSRNRHPFRNLRGPMGRRPKTNRSIEKFTFGRGRLGAGNVYSDASKV